MQVELLAFLLLSSGSATNAQVVIPEDKNVVLEVSIPGEQREFHIGEIIPLQLRFSSAVREQYQVNMAQYDRSGRMNYEQFKVLPESGSVDPLLNHLGGMGGGLTNFQFLNLKPWSITLNLNEWVRFTGSGEYRVTVTSNRVSKRDPTNSIGASEVLARGNEIGLKVIPATPEWQKEAFEAAVRDLQDGTKRQHALQMLRFLGTREAAFELVKQMRGAPSGTCGACTMGLISSPEQGAVKAALKQALADPDYPIDGNFLYLMSTVNADPADRGEKWREEQNRALEQLTAVLPIKHGAALSVSLSTAVDTAWNGGALPKQTTDQLVTRLIAMFDELPIGEKDALMGFRWDKVRGPAMLPALRREALKYQDFPNMREMNAFTSLQVSANALRRWYELDPADARPAVIAEIKRPRPRYGAHVLGMLPDKTLPEVDADLAAHFTASDDYEGLANLASLIGRYATDAILPQVLQKVDPKFGKFACAIQDPILAYVLRVDPAMARPRIEKAVATRGPQFTACNGILFQEISEIFYDPVLEEIAIHSLDDPDPRVAETAATMLGKYGSAEAESALLKRYLSWCAAWEGHESDLDLMTSELVGERVFQLGLGENLATALATGASWMTDGSSLRRLLQATKVKRVQQRLGELSKLWEKTPMPITLMHNAIAPDFDALVAQYELHSLDALEKKLAQFPSGTTFFIAGSESEEKSAKELRTFLLSHGMLVTEKPAN